MRLRAGSFAFLVTLAACAVAHAQAPTLINFQGKLSETDGTPVTGSPNIGFAIYDTETGGTPVWTQGPASVSVNKGLFSVILNGITPDILNHTACWLEMEVDSEIMSPRQQLVSVAFAQVAADADTLDSLDSTVFWQLGGNAITDPTTEFIGTTGTALELHAGTRALRLEPGASPNVIGGHMSNSVTAGVAGATIGGGGGMMIGPNVVTGDLATIGGGDGNEAFAMAAVGGGLGNLAWGPESTIAGGSGNMATDMGAAVGGGTGNQAGGPLSVVGGGDGNVAWGWHATVPGGEACQAFGDNSFAAGQMAEAATNGTFVWADATDLAFTSTAANQFLIRAGGGVGIGTNDPSEQLSVAGVVESTTGGFRFPDATVQTTAAVNQPPVALLGATRQMGYFGAGIVYELDAGESYDPEGTATLQYAWDFSGMGQFGAPGASSTTLRLFDSGTHLPGVRVSEGGTTSESKVLIKVGGSTATSASSHSGSYVSLCVVDGNPAVAYEVSGSLMYVRANDAQGTSWPPSATGADNPDVGSYASLCVVDGHPAISYYDDANGDLMYIRATDPQGIDWGLPFETPVTVDSADDVGRFTSLCVVDSNPAISYLDATNGSLKYVRATDAQGATWGSPVTVDTIGAFDWDANCTLCVVDDRPAIAYYGHTDTDLMFVRASDAHGTAWGAPVTVDTDGGVYSSLCVVDGNPAISYHDYGDLKYVRATDAQGTTWDTPLTLDATGPAEQYTSLCVVEGKPGVSYLGMGGFQLRFVGAVDAQGATWHSPVVLDDDAYPASTSLCEVDGRPAISYRGGGDVKYVISP
ncbi:MAG: hypothetical protein ACYS9X_17430 [Planctomycetota bacterium]|jgi:hypothetical protein